MKLYHGHERTVTCLAVFLDFIAAGGNDNICLGKTCRFFLSSTLFFGNIHSSLEIQTPSTLESL